MILPETAKTIVRGPRAELFPSCSEPELVKVRTTLAVVAVAGIVLIPAVKFTDSVWYRPGIPNTATATCHIAIHCRAVYRNAHRAVGYTISKTKSKRSTSHTGIHYQIKFLHACNFLSYSYLIDCYLSHVYCWHTTQSHRWSHVVVFISYQKTAPSFCFIPKKSGACFSYAKIHSHIFIDEAK